MYQLLQKSKTKIFLHKTSFYVIFTEYSATKRIFGNDVVLCTLWGRNRIFRSSLGSKKKENASYLETTFVCLSMYDLVSQAKSYVT